MRVLIGVVWLGVAAACGLPSAALSEDTPSMITTDTPAYCGELLDHLAALVHLSRGPPSDRVLLLSDEGRRMCESGQTRNGIARLRRAIMLLKQLEDER